MSKYHMASNLLAAVGGIPDELELENYGSAGFRLYRREDGMPLTEQEARREISLALLSDTAMMDRYRAELDRMDEKERRRSACLVEWYRDALSFQHGEFEGPVHLPDGIVASGPSAYAPSGRDRDLDRERGRALDRKLESVLSTGEDDYLAHVSQVGYLMRYARLRIMWSQNMQAPSVKMQVHGPRGGKGKMDKLTMGELRQFTDAGGRPLALNSHEGSGGLGDSEPVNSDWTGFALQLMDFMDLSPEAGGPIDIRALASQCPHGPKGNFMPLSEWGADPHTVLKNLKGRRPDIDPDMIEEFFNDGYNEGKVTYAAPQPESGGDAPARAAARPA